MSLLLRKIRELDMRKPSLHPKEKSGTEMDGWDLQIESQVGPLMGLRFGPELGPFENTNVT